MLPDWLEKIKEEKTFEFGIIPGVHNPHQGPSIRFEPGTRPKYIPER